jgi:hypothetical protein
LPETAVPVKCRGMLSKYANKDLIPAEKNAWKSKATA